MPFERVAAEIKAEMNKMTYKDRLWSIERDG